MDVNNLINTVEPLFLTNAYLISFFASFIEISPMGWIIPGAYILATGGFFSFTNDSTLLGIITFASLGSWAIFVIAYFLGFKTGLYLVKKLKQEKNAQKAKFLLERHGGRILTASLMSPPIRFWVAYIAGSQRYNFSKFIIYSGLASFGWSTMWVMIGYFAGSQRQSIQQNLAKFGILGWVFVIAPIFIIGWAIRKDYKEIKK